LLFATVGIAAEDYRPSRRSGMSAFQSPHANPRLLFLGTYHSFDANDPQHAEVERLFNEFKPTWVLLEGGNWPVAASRTEAITQYGEMGWTRLLADRSGITTATFEPRMSDEIATVLKQHPAEDVKLYYTLRWVPQFEATDPTEQAENLAQQLRWLNRIPGLDIAPTTLDELNGFCQRRLGVAGWREVGYEWTDPVTRRKPRPKSFLNTVAASSAAYRNANLERLARAAIKRGERILIVAGRAHLIESMPQLDVSRMAEW
jgi:hypothetical protein